MRLRAMHRRTSLLLAASSAVLTVGLAVPASASAPPSVEAVAVNVAAQQVGKPYRWGATGPNAFDCSGLTMYAFKKAGRTLPRTTMEQYRAVRHIPLSQVRPGDLVFMADSGSSTNVQRIDHVGIYAGHNSWYVARHSGTLITRQTLWTRNLWVGRP